MARGKGPKFMNSQPQVPRMPAQFEKGLKGNELCNVVDALRRRQLKGGSVATMVCQYKAMYLLAHFTHLISSKLPFNSDKEIAVRAERALCNQFKEADCIHSKDQPDVDTEGMYSFKATYKRGAGTHFERRLQHWDLKGLLKAEKGRNKHRDQSVTGLGLENIDSTYHALVNAWTAAMGLTDLPYPTEDVYQSIHIYFVVNEEGMPADDSFISVVDIAPKGTRPMAHAWMPCQLHCTVEELAATTNMGRSKAAAATAAAPAVIPIVARNNMPAAVEGMKPPTPTTARAGKTVNVEANQAASAPVVDSNALEAAAKKAAKKAAAKEAKKGRKAAEREEKEKAAEIATKESLAMGAGSGACGVNGCVEGSMEGVTNNGTASVEGDSSHMASSLAAINSAFDTEAVKVEKASCGDVNKALIAFKVWSIEDILAAAAVKLAPTTSLVEEQPASINLTESSIAQLPAAEAASDSGVCLTLVRYVPGSLQQLLAKSGVLSSADDMMLAAAQPAGELTCEQMTYSPNLSSSNLRSPIAVWTLPCLAGGVAGMFIQHLGADSSHSTDLVLAAEGSDCKVLVSGCSLSTPHLLTGPQLSRPAGRRVAVDCLPAARDIDMLGGLHLGGVLSCLSGSQYMTNLLAMSMSYAHLPVDIDTSSATSSAMASGQGNGMSDAMSGSDSESIMTIQSGNDDGHSVWGAVMSPTEVLAVWSEAVTAGLPESRLTEPGEASNYNNSAAPVPRDGAQAPADVPVGWQQNVQKRSLTGRAWRFFKRGITWAYKVAGAMCGTMTAAFACVKPRV